MKDEGIKIIKRFKGNSGCGIFLIEKGENYLVRKISKSIDYNERLKKQMLKQKLFYESFSNEEISCPKIIDSGFYGDLFYFDMEYIDGLTLIEYSYEATLEELTELSKIIINIINHIKNQIPLENEIDLSKSFELKIGELKSKINENFLPLLSKLEEKSKNLPKLKSFFCHGDLTLENILINKKTKKCYLIDFQDIFAEHYWFDISTIFQDVDEGWYMLNHQTLDPKIMKIKMDFIRQNIIDKIETDYLKYHKLFMSMKFFRIVPYLGNEFHNYLLTVISKNLYD